MRTRTVQKGDDGSESWTETWTSESSDDGADDGDDGTEVVVVTEEEQAGSIQEVIEAIRRLFTTYRREIVVFIRKQDFVGLEQFLRRVSSGGVLQGNSIVMSAQLATNRTGFNRQFRLRLVVVYVVGAQAERRRAWRPLVPDAMGQHRRPAGLRSRQLRLHQSTTRPWR